MLQRGHFVSRFLVSLEIKCKVNIIQDNLKNGGLSRVRLEIIRVIEIWVLVRRVYHKLGSFASELAG
jgi:hypothetical protein